MTREEDLDAIEDVKSCENCGMLFESKYPTQKFCSRNCYLEYRKTTAKKDEKTVTEEDNPDYPETCDVCGSPKYMGRCVRFTQHKKNQPK